MEKKLKIIVRFLLGITVGAYSICRFSGNAEVIALYYDIFQVAQSDITKIHFTDVVAFAMDLFFSGILVLILLILLCTFSNSKNIYEWTKLLIVTIQVVFGIPFTLLVYALLDIPIQAMKCPVSVRILIGAFIFALLYEGMCMAVEKYMLDFVKDMPMHWSLIICTVVDATTYVEEGVLSKKLTYDMCHSVIDRDDDFLKPNQFFKIVEWNWNRKKRIENFNYYRNGVFVDITDEMLCKKLMDEQAL